MALYTCKACGKKTPITYDGACEKCTFGNVKANIKTRRKRTKK